MVEIDNYIDYLKFEKRYSIHTITSYHNDISQFEKYVIQRFDISLLNVDFSHIRSWIVYLTEEGISKASINRKITSLRSFYKYLKANSLVQHNPATKIKLLKTPKKLPVFVEEDSMEKLFTDDLFGEDYKSRLSKAIIELLYGTGMRVSELVNIRFVDIDWYHKQLKVLGKRNKERIIPLNDVLIQNLHLYNKVRNEFFSKNNIEPDKNYLFVSPKGKKIYNKFVYRIINYYLSLVTTIKKRSPHVIRHTFATHLLNQGADLNAIKEILGHANLSATQIYTHNSIEKLKDVYKQAHPKA